ncbi:helix-hairpin-helix domain-containing protein [Campylobacter ureolyticus]|uniref:ComEA family DNA-binding protein n=1 Tax=Campylobacter ureolyticus TaxID=827 RepID=UPI0022B317AF|nr:helix-hairpin-helix domain-containing protein [Campylobacter ureolyticus]MCZ6133680.1 helix-hairpin-helix domain-containing protein [Campylobacter ureolyticus]
MKRLLLLFVFSFSLLFGAVNINTASKEELMTLKGIGEATAEAIIEYRKENKFIKIEDIKNVKGIGDKKFESIKEDIEVKDSKK